MRQACLDERSRRRKHEKETWKESVKYTVYQEEAGCCAAAGARHEQAKQELLYIYYNTNTLYVIYKKIFE